MPEAPISKAQLRRLQTLSGHLFRQFGSPEQDARTFRLSFIGGKLGRDLASFSDLTKDEAVTAIRAVQKCLPADAIRAGRRRSGPEAGRAGRKNRKSDPAVLVSGRTLDLLASLRSQLGWTSDDRFFGFVKRQLKGRTRIVTEADGNRVIWGLKRILRGGQRLTHKQTLNAEENRTAENLAGISACSGCPGPVDGDPHGRDRGEPEDCEPGI